jgi:hypothetical protein
MGEWDQSDHEITRRTALVAGGVTAGMVVIFPAQHHGEDSGTRT